MKKNKLLVSLKNISIHFQQGKSFKLLKKKTVFKALKDVSFDLYEGDILGVVGRNGSGKSTTLSVIAGITAPNSGEVIINSKQVSLLNFASGMIPYLSGRDNIFLQGYFLNMSKKAIQKNLEQIIELSELEKFIDQPVNTYSTGMKTKLGFAIAYYSNTEIILIDETLGVGDFKFKKKSTELMKEKILQNSAAVIVTHDEALLKSMCTKCVLIDKGNTVAIGSPEEILAKYHSL